MTHQNELGKQLLSQNGVVPGELSDGERERIRTMIAKEDGRIRLMKRVMKVSWMALGACILLLVGLVLLVEPPARDAVGIVVVVLYMATVVLLPWAVYCSIRLYLVSRAVTMRQMQTRLAAIEDQLRSLPDGPC